MIRRHKTTMFLDAKENTTVFELKRMIEGITKKPPTEQRLYNKDDAVGTFQNKHVIQKCIFRQDLKQMTIGYSELSNASTKLVSYLV